MDYEVEDYCTNGERWSGVGNKNPFAVCISFDWVRWDDFEIGLLRAE